MNRIVCNASPLIYLTKVERLDLLKSIFDEVIIPLEVKKEVIDAGKRLKEKDAYIIEKAVKDGWIKVVESKPIEIQIKIHKGEEAVISLAMELKLHNVLIDEISARTAAKLLDLEPRGTLYVLLKALKLGFMDFDEFMEVLNQLIREGFRLNEEIYISAVKEAKKISES
ncbi:MAG: DUF3368 domain-containing protein [Candidatus Altiarchaeota archaeon]|nr:DUF3368 domain-containing protein [Candidatus Altiarchaeota archaeon]